MVIFDKFNDKGQVVIQAGLQMFYKIQGRFTFPFAIEWFVLDGETFSRNGKKIKTKKWYNLTVNFLCFYLDLQLDVYEK